MGQNQRQQCYWVIFIEANLNGPNYVLRCATKPRNTFNKKCC